MSKYCEEDSLSLDNIAKRIRRKYGFSRADFTSGRISEADQVELICEALKFIGNGRLLLPNSLHDGYAKKYYRAKNKKAFKKLQDISLEKGCKLYKYVVSIEDFVTTDNVWSPRTIGKAKTVEEKFFESLGLGGASRISKLERQACEVGGFHLQGVSALPSRAYAYRGLQVVEGDLFTWGMYLSKVSEQSLERDEFGHLAYNNLPLALRSTRTWYVQSLQNRRNGVSRNPSTAWKVGIPNDKREDPWA